MTRHQQVSTSIIDLTHERCPKAFVLCKQALLQLKPGESLEVRFQDQSSVTDIVAWCHSQPLQVSVFHTNNWVQVQFVLNSE